MDEVPRQAICPDRIFDDLKMSQRKKSRRDKLKDTDDGKLR